MIRIEQFVIGAIGSFGYEKSKSKLEEFISKIGKERIVNIVASPAAILKDGQGITPPTCFTIFYED